MSHRVIIGTAGHIDHGKTTLVRAMTGIDTDRLKEEKKRGISIELGFAPLRLPSGQIAGLVDVPGHERFIKHMLAGAFGVDLVILVIAADEGVMPQTREHVDIIELLGIKKGIVVLTKKDLVDEEWLLLVEDEVKQYLSKTILQDAPVIAVSSTTREGLPELMELLDKIAGDVEEKPAFGQARLPIDRVFKVVGFGTVITGTLWSGTLKVGDMLEVLPTGQKVRVRNLEVHKEKVESALAGQRVAVNLQGIEAADLERGFVLATPGFISPTFRIDTSLRLLSSSPWTLRNWHRIRFHLGTDECLGRVVLLDRDELTAGEEAYAQIILERPIVANKHDHFVLRFYSPVTTIGGGVVIDAHPPKQKRFKEEVLKELAIKEEGSLDEMLLHELDRHSERPLPAVELAKSLGQSEASVLPVLTDLVTRDEVRELKLEGKSYYLSAFALEQLLSSLLQSLEAYHRKYHLRSGYSKEELRSRYFNDFPVKQFNQLLIQLEGEGRLQVKGSTISLPGFTPTLSESEQKQVTEALNILQQDLLSPPFWSEVAAGLKVPAESWDEITAYLVETEQLIKLADDMYFLSAALDKARTILREYFAENKELSLSAARDLFGNSRKYALPILEYFDRLKLTRRLGDNRVQAGKL
ncbi:MAG: selenocysteine-specific translation elongation factor [Methylocystaceae bacterium]